MCPLHAVCDFCVLQLAEEPFVLQHLKKLHLKRSTIFQRISEYMNGRKVKISDPVAAALLGWYEDREPFADTSTLKVLLRRQL